MPGGRRRAGICLLLAYSGLSHTRGLDAELQFRSSSMIPLFTKLQTISLYRLGGLPALILSRMSSVELLDDPQDSLDFLEEFQSRGTQLTQLSMGAAWKLLPTLFQILVTAPYLSRLTLRIRLADPEPNILKRPTIIPLCLHEANSIFPSPICLKCSPPDAKEIAACAPLKYLRIQAAWPQAGGRGLLRSISRTWLEGFVGWCPALEELDILMEHPYSAHDFPF